MRIGILSDLHLDYRQSLIQAILFRDMGVLPTLGFPPAGDPGVDLIIIAGDIHPGASIRDAFRRMLLTAYPNAAVIMTEGNHDFYGSTFPIEPRVTVDDIGGLKVVATTLWSLCEPRDEALFETFQDRKFITGATPSRWNQNYGQSLCQLIEAEADIVVTHHAPSSASVHPDYKEHKFTRFYHSEVDFSLFPKTKLWVHGHVHDEFDYAVEGMPDLRVVCNPLGYPFENKRVGTQMRVIEV
jgi:DNA repair exonuclease SbcCD nuclease subunit